MAAVHPGKLAQDPHTALFDDQLYRLIAETIPHMVWTARADGATDYQNGRVYEYTGLDAARLAGWGWKSVVHPEDWERCVGAWSRALEKGERYELEYRLRRADGEYRWHRASAVPLRTSTGDVFRWFGTATDIEAEVRSAQMLEQRFRLFMENFPGTAWIRDAQFRYTYVNRRYASAWGYEPEALVGRDAAELFPPATADYFRQSDLEVAREGAPIQYVDGEPSGRWIKMKFPVPDGAGGIGVAGIGLDITARVAAEDKARQYADEVHDLVKRLVETQEAERRRVAGELHDLIGQNLTALGIDLQALKQRLQAGGDLIAGPRLDAMALLLDTTIDAIRGVMTELRPAALEEFGLVPALRWYASEFSKRTGIKVATKAPRREVRLPAGTELALFRIVQEALTNAAKHSGGGAVEIRIRYGDRLTLSVQDDGRGFADSGAARGARRAGFGLTTMRERAEALGGSLRVEFPERGTRVVVELPSPSHGD